MLRTVRSGPERRQQGERELGAEAAGAEQALKDLPLRRRCRSRYSAQPSSFTTSSVKRLTRAAGRGQPHRHADRHGHRVAHAAIGLHHERLAVAFGEDAA